jgi:aminopeptidase YwaD
MNPLSILQILCDHIPNRAVGSEGNRMATDFFEKEMRALGWQTETPAFDAIDWNDGGALLRVGEVAFEVLVSPYSLGCAVEAELVEASTVDALEALDARSKIVLLHGELAQEQLMPKNFVFYNPESHRRIVALLENSGAAALVCATGRNAALAGGVYPFPLIEDGDFDVPSVYMTEEEGARLLLFAGQTAALHSVSERIPGKGCNVIARKGNPEGKRIVLTAHIDAKKGTPGAIDNGTGVVTLLLIAELLKDYQGEHLLEIVAFNGEDYYAVSGQMQYIGANQGRFDSILMNINFDGLGYKEGLSAVSFYEMPEEWLSKARSVFSRHSAISEGPPWPQGDHSIFVQFGVPAIAFTSEWFSEHINDQDITHTPKDNLGIVAPERLPEVARAVADLVGELGGKFLS